MFNKCIVFTIVSCALQLLFAADSQTYSGLDTQKYSGIEEPQRYLSLNSAATHSGLEAQRYLKCSVCSEREAAAKKLALVPTEKSPGAKSTRVESRSLALPSAWVERDDVLNPALDFMALLNKAKVSGLLPVRNNTGFPISIHISGQQVTEEDSAPENVELDLTIAAGKMVNFLNMSSYTAISLNTGSSGFLNFCSTKTRFEVSVESAPVLLFPRPLAPFSFVPDIETPSVGSNEKEQLQIQQYRSHVGFMQYVCKQEGINPDDLYLQRKRLYEAFKLEAIVERPLSYIPRIPLNLFSIWLTNLDNPKEPEQDLVDLALASSRTNSRADGWNHYFLVQDTALFPKTVKALEGSDVQIVRFSDLLGSLELQSELDQSVTECKFGMASDILRVEAIREMGGGYLDIDLQTLQSLKLYFYAYNSLFGIEPMSEFIGNAFMAASPHHPVMQEMTRLIKRNFALKRANDKTFYSAIAPDNGFNTIVQTGPCVTTVAFYNAAGRDGNIDAAMPPEAFYPALSLKRPEFGIPTMVDPVNLTSATIHLWLTNWAGPRGAKNGSKG